MIRSLHDLEVVIQNLFHIRWEKQSDVEVVTVKREFFWLHYLSGSVSDN